MQFFQPEAAPPALKAAPISKNITVTCPATWRTCAPSQLGRAASPIFAPATVPTGAAPQTLMSIATPAWVTKIAWPARNRDANFSVGSCRGRQAAAEPEIPRPVPPAPLYFFVGAYRLSACKTFNAPVLPAGSTKDSRKRPAKSLGRRSSFYYQIHIGLAADGLAGAQKCVSGYAALHGLQTCHPGRSVAQSRDPEKFKSGIILGPGPRKWARPG